MRHLLRRLWSLLEAHERKALRTAIRDAIFLGLLEILGLLLVYPALLLLVSTNTARVSIGHVRLALAPSDLPYVLLGAVGILVLKSGLAIVLIGRQLRRVYRAEAAAAGRLIARRLEGSFLAHSQQNSAQLLWVAEGALSSLYANGVVPLVALSADLVQGLAALSVVVLIAPGQAAIAVGLFGLIIGVYHKLTAKYSTETGRRLQHDYQQSSAAVMDASRGLREIRVTGTQQFFLERFTGPRDRLGQSRAKLEYLAQVPRYLLEASLMLVTGALAALLFATRDRASAVAALGLFFVAGIRLLPAFSRIVASLSKLHATDETMTLLEAERLEFGEPEAHRTRVRQAMQTAGTTRQHPFLRVSGLSYRYPGSEGWAIEGLSLELERGQRLAVAGPSGAGKSTLAHLLIGLFAPSSGSFEVQGMPVASLSEALGLGFVAQEPYILAQSIAENVRFGRPGISDEAIVAQLEALGLRPLLEQLNDGLATQLGDAGSRLSGGQLQRLALARALALNPDLLVIDEGTSALDNETEWLVDRAMGANEHLTQIVIAHRTSTIRRCDLVLWLGETTPILASFDELVVSSDAFRQMVRIGASK